MVPRGRPDPPGKAPPPLLNAPIHFSHSLTRLCATVRAQASGKRSKDVSVGKGSARGSAHAMGSMGSTPSGDVKADEIATEGSVVAECFKITPVRARDEARMPVCRHLPP